MMEFSFGDIVLVNFPFTDLTTIKRRPAIVISSSDYHINKDDVIILAVTSKINPIENIGECEIEKWEDAGLLKPSLMKAVVATVSKDIIFRAMGKLEEGDKLNLSKLINKIIDK